MKKTLAVLLFLAALGSASTARAIDFGVALSIGEGVTFVDGEAFRSPVSLELIPSIALIPWLRLDLGMYATLEDLRVGDHDFILRPGVRFMPPILPLYARFAIPLRTTNEFDWGFLLGAGVSFKLIPHLAIFGEVDTFLTDDGDFGGDVFPLDFRAGVELTF